MITSVNQNTAEREFDAFIDKAFTSMCLTRDKTKQKVTYDDEKQELLFYYTDGTIDRVQIVEAKS